ncbi:hypothetical protein [Cylindrospermum stagnale]|uniref:hypothetical protein n=1 Tax=Cylindrospermum stagnale TaxID=142864 RepID=UPI0002DF6F2B|nr:hypothetical protein [Cylindrospermum stagnale]
MGNNIYCLYVSENHPVQDWWADVVWQTVLDQDWVFKARSPKVSAGYSTTWCSE